eukprot:CAMPEP_0175991202 /NCGR_PEP_ID=MMETSP0108-20121206/52722_1 /TAXON_ID=195067 ORGANISM="Goniomonas pacifica, Strain CCMP1869" /NCGR_SAMPLE_ID=MMETSP0108 /ASSEMBLY_ACC=CAM_ASM_000204 /LENGTH=65 /DNA_ID=CAMNT_0017322741 /DNA_START=147 /DNA_END=344 /DNA_ORIENTATION=-
MASSPWSMVGPVMSYDIRSNVTLGDGTAGDADSWAGRAIGIGGTIGIGGGAIAGGAIAGEAMGWA